MPVNVPVEADGENDAKIRLPARSACGAGSQQYRAVAPVNLSFIAREKLTSSVPKRMS
jgi:hypothetical protein